MALDEFKTQVLLLHSEQSTLDSLSSGFGDRYTVHCATSGSEALNTLVDTPINVIVSAQNLPGMSGLEALREAKKRSPETIGILLAEGDNEDLEALVSDREVFQIVRGNVTSEAVLALVEDATQQVRLTALAESANDTAADVAVSTGEHIVMETAENGSTIISDGTDRLRALNAPRGTVSVGSQSVDLLVLTKDQDFLATIKESSRGMHTVHYATTLAQAVDTLQKQKVGVVVVDAAMVGDRVEQLTQHLRSSSARLVAIVAGRREDGEMLMDLINRGKVYRFLLKPVSPGRARLAVEASVKHHLEAPDAAFESKLAAATKPPAVSKPPARTAQKTDAKPAAKPEKPPAPAVEKTEPQPVTPSAPTPPDPAADSSGEVPAIAQEFPDTLGESDSGFTETVAGLISSVGEKISGNTEKSQPEEGRMTDAPETDDAEAGGSFLGNPKLLGVGAVLLAVVAGALFWFMGGSDEIATGDRKPQQSAEDAGVGVDEPVVDSTLVDSPVVDMPRDDVDELAQQARLARDAGQLFEPESDNAIELYAAAIAANPGNPIVAAELDDVVQETLRFVESALMESRIEEATVALQRVSSVDPDNTRLPFLLAQLSQVELREYLVTARSAIRESRFDDAENALASARALDVADTAEIDAVGDELNTARSIQQADDVLAMAQARLEDNALLSPPNDNARYFYELALSIDPNNTAASQGLSLVASKLVLQARSEIEQRNFRSAEALLDDAIDIDSASAEVAAAVGELASERRAVAAERKAAEERAAAERAAEEQRAADAAARQAAEERAAQNTVEPAAEPVQMAVEAPPEDASTEGGNAVPEANDDSGSNIVTDDEPAAEMAKVPDPASSATPVVEPASVSSLTRRKYVAPKYPRAAQRRNLSGWVDVAFTVTTDGTVKDVAVRGSEPGDTFVNSATRAVEKWEFEPVVENGMTVEKRVGVRMLFAVE